jgi:FkbM family methyltransferase
MQRLSPVIFSILENRPVEWPKYLLSAFVWQVRKFLKHIFVYQLPNRAKVKIYPSTAYSGIFYQRHPEGTDLVFIRKHASLSDTFIDVGANVGLFSASLFDKFTNFVCFEPAPSSFRALSETSKLNSDINFELHNIGVGDSDGRLHFENEFDFSTTSRFVKVVGKNTIDIDVDTLDHVLGNRFPSMVMKVDVEGFEEKVFAGADLLFGKKLVKLVMFERLGRTNLSNIRLFLESRDYVVFRVKNDLSVTTEESEISVPCINLFACPKNIFSDLCSKENDL